MTEQSKILTQAEQAQALLSTAQDLMTAGRLVSIAALKKMVESLCRAFDSVPADERRLEGLDAPEAGLLCDDGDAAARIA